MTVVSEVAAAPLPVVDGRELPAELRRLLRPGETVTDAAGRRRRLPRHFFEIASWETARSVRMAPFFGLYELISVDLREAAALRRFPRYVPLATAQLAAALSLLRQHLGTYVHVAANGGYRSPAHGASRQGSVHAWGTAANLVRIGDEPLDSKERIGRYAEVVRELLPGVWCRPWGREPGATLDHLHLDLGRYAVPARDAADDAETDVETEADAETGPETHAPDAESHRP